MNYSICRLSQLNNSVDNNDKLNKQISKFSKLISYYLILE